jgi:hypothetical protein
VPLEDGLAGFVGVREDRGIDVDHHLVALGGGAGVDAVVEGRFREQRQRVGLLLGHGGRFRGNVWRAGRRVIPARPLVQRLARCGQRLDEQGADLGRQAPAERHHTVLVPIHVERPALVAVRGLAGLRVAVHAPPAAHDPFDVLRRAGAPDSQQHLLGLRRRHARQGADLGVRELSASQGLGETRQRPERARYSYPLPCCAQVESHPPAQPGGAGAESVAPTLSGVELADEIQEARSRSVEVRRKLGDLVAQSVQVWREILHGVPPLCWGDSTPEFRSHPGGTTRGDFGAIDIFRDEPTRRAAPVLRGPLGRYSPRAADTARWPMQKAVKRKSRVEPGKFSRLLLTFRYADLQQDP